VAEAQIDGRAASLDAAVAEAARLLAASRLPVIAGLGSDVGCARAAVTLAERLGGVIDHMHSDALLRDVHISREGARRLRSSTTRICVLIPCWWSAPLQ
jgi:formylmethanofuran dehydrogenase subunit B